MIKFEKFLYDFLNINNNVYMNFEIDTNSEYQFVNNSKLD